MIFIKNKLIPFKGFNAITIWPFVFYKKDGLVMRNHERIHWMQQFEIISVMVLVSAVLTKLIGFNWWYVMLYLVFYVIYVVEWLVRLILKSEDPYFDISFEQEAYDNQWENNYWKKRRFFGQWRK